MSIERYDVYTHSGDGSPTGRVFIDDDRRRMWFEDVSFGGGSTDLTNIDSDLLPSADNTYTHGDATHRWKEGHYSDFIAIGASSLIHVPAIDLSLANDLDGFEIGGADIGEIRFRINGSIYGAIHVEDGDLAMFSGFGFEAFESNYPDATTENGGSLNLYYARLAFTSKKATAIAQTKSPGDFLLEGAWWDGADSARRRLGISYNIISGGSSNLRFSFVESGVDVKLDNTLNLYPSGNDLGSLGKIGNTWGDIYATLPTSDPAVAGQFWEFTGDITALTNYLAGGGRLVAIGNP